MAGVRGLQLVEAGLRSSDEGRRVEIAPSLIAPSLIEPVEIIEPAPIEPALIEPVEIAQPQK